MFRLLKIIFTSILCSLPIYIGYVVNGTDNVILFISFIAFIIAIGIDTYQFSSTFWKMQAYYFGQLLPLILYSVTGILTCFLFPPIVFNRIYLPLRIMGCFGLSTKKSVVLVSIFIILVVTGLRFAGAISGRSNHNMFIREDDGTEG